MGKPTFLDILTKLVKNMGLCVGKRGTYRDHKSFHVTYDEKYTGTRGFPQNRWKGLEGELRNRRQRSITMGAMHSAICEIEHHPAASKITVVWWTGGQAHYNCSDPDLPDKIEKSIRKIKKTCSLLTL